MMRRFANRTGQLLIDVGLLAIAYICAYLLRFEGRVPVEMVRTLALTLPYVVALQYGLMFAYGVPRLAWRYVGLPDVAQIAKVIGIGVLILLAVRLVHPWALLRAVPWSVRIIIPIGIILSFGAFSFLGTVGIRVVWRFLSEREEAGHRANLGREPIPTILIGAGRAGVLAAKEAVARPDIGIVPVAFLDDDPLKMGAVVHGVPVVGTTAEVGRHAARLGAKQALITIAAAPGNDIRRISQLCERDRIPVKIIPGLFEIVGGRVNLSRIRAVSVEDLLRREPVTLDEEAILAVVRDRVVLVTGAGGSIGSELCRQICRFSPKELVLLEHSENNLFHIERELKEKFPEVPVLARMGDIRDATRVAAIFGERRPQVVFHAAAHKHVPMMEANPSEAITNNVLGTKLLAEIADEHGVSEFVMISTDKAVNPSSVMGASKRAAEIVIQALSQRSKTRFVAVRFGNVLGSAGSVVPIFQEQIARGGPVTVTHPEMKRYFMTIPEACQLVLQAGAMGRGGEIFVLDMGEPVKIVDLARDVIALSGLRVGEDIEIQFTGIRPGEKLYEELSLQEEGAERTRHPKVFIGRIKAHPWSEVERHALALARVAESGNGDRVRDGLRALVPEYVAPATKSNGERAQPGVVPAAGGAAYSIEGSPIEAAMASATPANRFSN
jgi:FlaA1/EpsC-like NDP-sugar epimerase